MLSPAQFEAAYPGTFFLDLEDPGPKLLIAADTTVAALPLQKALNDQQDTLIAEFEMAIIKRQIFLASLFAAVPEDAQRLMQNNNDSTQGLVLLRFLQSYAYTTVHLPTATSKPVRPI